MDVGRRRPVMLVILDGWGISDTKPSAVTCAHLPNYRRLLKEYPSSVLEASGEAVGLMPGQMGDSNVGHLNIGAGRIVYQELVRIFRDIKSGALFENPALLGAIENVMNNSSALHFMGLLSDGGVHSHEEHLYALLELAKKRGIREVFIHAFLDGRDVPPKSAATYLERLEKKLAEIGTGQLVSITGRYYAMDRDRRWDRTEKAFRMLTEGEGRVVRSWQEGLFGAYEHGETDEFVPPTVISDGAGPYKGIVKSGDSLVFFNFRSDRARQISHAFCDEEFTGFQRGKRPQVYFCGMMRYEEDLSGHFVYEPLILNNTLGEVVSRAGLRQLRIAETEKYAHVTFFFSGKKEEPFPGEDRCLVPSPKVATYDLKPEMSAFEVTEEAIKRIREKVYDLIVLNYANPDMVGHTGVFEAGVKALEAVDTCLGNLLGAFLSEGGIALVIADHGNIEELVPPEQTYPGLGGENGQAGHTYHTSNPVPCILVGDLLDFGRDVKLRSGILSDVAPTILDLLGLPKPPEMDRESLLVRA
ncbi:MAG TPA: 2,3-bisphosphoglycerate-independent phosphoglycerate mutase [Firmicutes bacterium]|nr:2,3-bisphosphoglycerate-independent phosphoglycerate mutase [Candidatus Fermentithermobacillaceae bacterium]